MGSVSDEPFTFASPLLATAVLPRWVNQQGCLYGVSVTFYDLACESRDVLRNQRRDPVSLIESKARERKVHHLDCSTLGCERCRWDNWSRSLRYHMRSHWKRWSSGVRTVICRWPVSISRWMARVGKPPVLGMGREKLRKELRVVTGRRLGIKGSSSSLPQSIWGFVRRVACLSLWHRFMGSAARQVLVRISIA